MQNWVYYRHASIAFNSYWLTNNISIRTRISECVTCGNVTHQIFGSKGCESREWESWEFKRKWSGRGTGRDKKTTTMFACSICRLTWGVIKFNQGVSSESISYILVELEPKFVWPGCWVLCVHNFQIGLSFRLNFLFFALWEHKIWTCFIFNIDIQFWNGLRLGW